MFWPFKKKQNRQDLKPRYRLRPRADGRYSLEKLRHIYSGPDWHFITLVDSQEAGEKAIKNLERDTLYFIEARKDGE